MTSRYSSQVVVAVMKMIRWHQVQKVLLIMLRYSHHSSLLHRPQEETCPPLMEAILMRQSFVNGRVIWLWIMPSHQRWSCRLWDERERRREISVKMSCIGLWNMYSNCVLFCWKEWIMISNEPKGIRTKTACFCLERWCLASDQIWKAVHLTSARTSLS